MSFDPFTYGLLASSGYLRVVLPRRRTLLRTFLLIVILCLTGYTQRHTLRANRFLTNVGLLTALLARESLLH
jgi:hypothetical protein